MPLLLNPCWKKNMIFFNELEDSFFIKSSIKINNTLFIHFITLQYTHVSHWCFTFRPTSKFNENNGIIFMRYIFKSDVWTYIYFIYGQNKPHNRMNIVFRSINTWTGNIDSKQYSKYISEALRSFSLDPTVKMKISWLWVTYKKKTHPN